MCQDLFVHLARSKQSKLFNKKNQYKNIYQRLVNDIKFCISNKQNKNQQLYDSIFGKNLANKANTIYIIYKQEKIKSSFSFSIIVKKGFIRINLNLVIRARFDFG